MRTHPIDIPLDAPPMVVAPRRYVELYDEVDDRELPHPAALTYETSAGGPFELTFARRLLALCQECGAVVADRGQHDKFHGQIEQISGHVDWLHHNRSQGRYWPAT